MDSNEYKFRESSVISSGNAIVDPLLNTPLGDGLGLLIVSFQQKFCDKQFERMIENYRRHLIAVL